MLGSGPVSVTVSYNTRISNETRCLDLEMEPYASPHLTSKTPAERLTRLCHGNLGPHHGKYLQEIHEGAILICSIWPSVDYKYLDMVNKRNKG